MRWLTIAPVHHYWTIDEALNTVFQFDEMVTLEPIPEWVRDGAFLEHLARSDRETISQLAEYAWSAAYDADSFGDPDPSSSEGRPRSKQDEASRRIRLANLAMWLAQPSCAGFRIVLDFECPDSTWQFRNYAAYPGLLARNDHGEAPFALGVLEDARELYQRLVSLPREAHLHTAVGMLWKALTEDLWQVRYLCLWVVVESLFGSVNPQETTYRLSQRAAFFLAPSRSAAKSFFDKIRAGYHWRSRVAHGQQPSQMKKLTPEASDRLLLEVEQTVQWALAAILRDANLIELFNSAKEREAYLDDLLFFK